MIHALRLDKVYTNPPGLAGLIGALEASLAPLAPREGHWTDPFSCRLAEAWHRFPEALCSCLKKRQQIFYHEQGTRYTAQSLLLMFQHPLISGVLSETICMDQDFHLFHDATMCGVFQAGWQGGGGTKYGRIHPQSHELPSSQSVIPNYRGVLAVSTTFPSPSLPDWGPKDGRV